MLRRYDPEPFLIAREYAAVHDPVSHGGQARWAAVHGQQIAQIDFL
jgi:hypothetical protein